MLWKVGLRNILNRDADNQPALARRAAFYLNRVVEHAAAMLEQSSHGDIVDVAQKVKIGKARFGAVFERVISRIKLPALRFRHRCFHILVRHPELVSG